MIFYDEKYDLFAPTHCEMDITNEDNVFSIFDIYKPDIVVHCAAISDVGLCDKEPEKSYKINVDGSINVAKASDKIHAKCIICSSDQVYFGSSIEAAHNEEEVLRPFNLYGQEKLKAEQEAFKANPRNICMCQDKIENCGISFSTTVNGLSRSFEKVLC